MSAAVYSGSGRTPKATSFWKRLSSGNVALNVYWHRYVFMGFAGFALMSRQFLLCYRQWTVALKLRRSKKW